MSLKGRLVLFLGALSRWIPLSLKEMGIGRNKTSHSEDFQHLIRQLIAGGLVQDKILWPDEAERGALGNLVAKFEGVIGMIDASPFRAPRAGGEHEEEQEFYRSDRGNHFWNAQVVCDPFGRARHVNIAPGSQSDRGLYISSDLYQSSSDHFSPGQGLIADGGCEGPSPGEDGAILTPFNRRSAEPAAEEEAFERAAFSRAQRWQRVIVEWGFGEVKNKWMLLSHGSYLLKRSLPPSIILVAVALSNFLFQNRSNLRSLEAINKTNIYCSNLFSEERLSAFRERCVTSGGAPIDPEEIADTLDD